MTPHAKGEMRLNMRLDLDVGGEVLTHQHRDVGDGGASVCSKVGGRVVVDLWEANRTTRKLGRRTDPLLSERTARGLKGKSVWWKLLNACKVAQGGIRKLLR
jgi:hypothetical protein